MRKGNAERSSHLERPFVCIKRIAGQYAKPRSTYEKLGDSRQVLSFSGPVRFFSLLLPPRVHFFLSNIFYCGSPSCRYTCPHLLPLLTSGDLDSKCDNVNGYVFLINCSSPPLRFYPYLTFPVHPHQ